jgi:hypothetical protein
MDDHASRDASPLVPPFIITGGRTSPARSHLDMATMVRAVQPGPPVSGLGPRHRAVLELCHSFFLSMAEVSAYIHEPMSVVKVVVDDLITSGHMAARSPRVDRRSKQTVLEELLRGLQKL